MLFNVVSSGLLAVLLAVHGNAQHIEPGMYLIHNAQTQTQLRSYQDHLLVSYARNNPGPFGSWHIQETQGEKGQYTIANAALHAYASGSESGQALRMTWPTAANTTFAITVVGGAVGNPDLYNIKVPNQNLFWSLDVPTSKPGDPIVHKTILLPEADSMDQQWWLTKDSFSVSSQQQVLGNQCN